MKKINLLAAITASVFMLVSASVWEGAAAVGENFPETGLFLATNTFPVNTIVEVVNLENDKTVNLIVSSSLENSGVLALLSKDAAECIGLNSSGRIRMRENDDQLSYSGPGERRFFSGDPNYTSDLDGLDLALIPAETRPPEDWQVPDPDYFISSIPAATTPPGIYEPPFFPVIPPVTQSVIPPSASVTPRLSVPMIQNFERGSYYVQIGAYRKMQTVESEIAKVDMNLPVAIMQIDGADEPIYRVLIGPLKLGESGAVFQRYKEIYKDAFLRVGL